MFRPYAAIRGQVFLRSTQIFYHFFSEAQQTGIKLDTRSPKTRTQSHQQKMYGTPTPGGLKLFTNKNAYAFWSLFWVNNFFKMINPFAIFASDDVKQLLSRLNVTIFQFCAEKCPKDAEVGELCGSAPPHPVRCPVYRL